MLLSKRAKRNSLSFVLGWVIGLAVVGGVALLIGGTQDLSPGSAPSVEASVIRLILGLVLLFAAYRRWARRPKAGQQPTMPHWLQFVDSFTPIRAFGLALLLAGVNPKNLLLAVGAAAGVAQLGLSTTDAVVSLIVLVVLGSLTIAGPVVYYLVGGDKAKTELDSIKGWLAAHNAAVMTVLFLVFGVDLIAKGLPPLTG